MSDPVRSFRTNVWQTDYLSTAIRACKSLSAIASLRANGNLSIGKKPIRLKKELPGHMANRFQAALYREMLYLIEQGVLSMEDTDAAVCYGPGLRWGVMGQSLQWHLARGAGGIKHFMDHLMPPLD